MNWSTFAKPLATSLILAGTSLGTVISAPTAVHADAGSYLAARQATIDRNLPEQAYYAQRFLLSNPQNTSLLETLLASKMSMGDFAGAHGAAVQLKSIEPNNQVAAMALIAGAVKNGEWDAVIEIIDNNQGISPLVDELTKAWAYVGKGDMSTALEQFDVATRQVEGFEAFSLYNRAIVLGLAGDFERGLALLDTRSGRISQNAVFARVQMLSQLERNDEARTLLSQAFGNTQAPYVRMLDEKLAQGETLDFDIVTSAQDGVAGLFQSVAEIVDGDLDDGYTLLYACVAYELRSERADYAIVVADLLGRMDHFDLATTALTTVAEDSPAYYVSALARARGLRATEQFDEEIELLQDLTSAHPDLSDAFSALGDAHRRKENYDSAVDAYTDALDLMPQDSVIQWPILFARGTAYERNDQWSNAESDFRAALKINPDQPQVLNYMGYAFLEMDTNLDEAMQMIQTAAEARPQDGYITDSLAWGLFQLGKYDEAVPHMEKAAQLEPVDPIINDHLGDVYWAVGRIREAEFQWRRALSFEPEADDTERIRQKLLIGLDSVLVEEGKEAIRTSLNN